MTSNMILKHIDNAVRYRGMRVIECVDDRRASFWCGMGANISRVTVDGKVVMRRV